MVELILAGLLIGAVTTAATVTGVQDRRRRKAERVAAKRTAAKRPGAPPSGEPIPSGWTGRAEGGAVDGARWAEPPGRQARRS